MHLIVSVYQLDVKLGKLSKYEHFFKKKIKIVNRTFNW